MPRPRERTTIVVTDASVLINLLHVGRLPMMATALGYSFVMPEEVLAEITAPEQRKTVETLLASGALRTHALTAPPSLAIFAELTLRFGRGESACLALAETEGWLLATDEGRRFRREIERRLGPDRVLGTVTLYVDALRSDLITLADADGDLVTLAANRFKTPIRSFRELL
jgi:predicted nucleic acid-binding protein